MSDNYQLGYPITADTPTVAMVHCQLGGNLVGVCCRKFPQLRPQASGAVAGTGQGFGSQSEYKGAAAPNGYSQESKDDVLVPKQVEARRQAP